MGQHEFCVGCKITFNKNYNTAYAYTIHEDHTVTCNPVANGELGVILSIEQFADGFCLKITDNDWDPAEAIVKTVICSRKIKNAIDYNHIDLGYATTSTKVQGKEFESVVFWNNTNPWHVWTLAHAFVAISRGKERVWLVSSQHDFDTICRNVDHYRRTVFSRGLDKCVFNMKTLNAGTVCPLEDLKIMPHYTSCVPTLLDTQQELDENE